ncbi:hypothetical protein PR003_g15915 [Phytophthora rubi]|uniref:DUF6818 domain-containing protein n=1 Tax=Phytophthora rubi TaxID=129364 RepID=A0A6A4EQG6_9STRA|nr:hypothetical protein PR001_g15473 [Phytophthora rubi]KAE9327889.1 hypothetical protein PR003_g15915 [Phytophthora rubi]
MQMVKLTGSPNYKISEINRLLTIVEEHLPLGEDEWARVATDYNLSRSRGWVERDLDSLRRKVKALYSMRKPTGTAEVPQHVQKSKEVKRAIDDKANVVEMDDDADEDQDEDLADSEDELFVEPDFRFDPNEGIFGDGEGGGDTLVTRNDALGVEGLGAFASTPQPSPLSAPPPTRQLHSAAVKKSRRTAASRASGTESTTPSKPPAARGFKARGRDEEEARRYSSLQSSSNRLGGTDLYAFRDSVGAKRAGGEDDREASFAKAKCIRAMKTTTVLKQRLSDLENSSGNSGSNVFEMMLLFREENERKSKARRGEEDQRRRDELAAREARALADKSEAEERRRQDKLELDERIRREKEDTRARTQEMLLLIGAIFKKD